MNEVILVLPSIQVGNVVVLHVLKREYIRCRFWRRVEELFTTISMIDGIREDSLQILENG
jgi:hypothetical protein